jgi:hypothetical protein
MTPHETHPKGRKPSKLLKAPGGSSKLSKGCLLALLGFGLMLWSILLLVVPHFDAGKQALDTAAAARATVEGTFALVLPNTAVRLRQLGGYNLEVWISQKDFESINYLDRKQLIDRIGVGWCRTATDDGWWWLPTISVRDERSGKALARYARLLGSRIDPLF